MIFESLAVKHKAFGDGIVVKSVGNYFTVKFENAEKTFVYPDVFEKYLTLADGTVSAEIMSDIEASKRAKQAILDKKNEENLRAMTRGIVIPGKEATHDAEDEESKFKEQENA
ncbi:MAG: hypothetical protein J6Q69_05410 [Clostridia bacterium]|nr:hypothetical protein [Clostridia bacterium]